MQGFDLTNCEQVAAEAGAGKASLYARYANKQELFTAVVQRSVDSMLTHQVEPMPSDQGVRERLGVAGNLILEHALSDQVVSLMRVVIGTAHRLPELAKMTNSIGRERGISIAVIAIAGARVDEPGALERALPAAAKFIDIAFVPFQLRALLGDDLATLVAEAPRAIRDAVDLLSAGGWLEGWR